MNKKIEYLKKVARPKKTSLAQMQDLSGIISELENIVIEADVEAAKETYDYADRLLHDAKIAAEKYVIKYNTLYNQMVYQMAKIEEADVLAKEIEDKFIELGVENPPELNDYFNKLEDWYSANSDALGAYENDFENNNELESIID